MFHLLRELSIFFPHTNPMRGFLKTHFYEYISIILLILKLEKRNTNFWLLKNPLEFPL